MTTLRKISSRDVASRAGVSQTTVSYVLNGRDDVAIPPATRQRVLDAARDLGYRANASAKAMRSGRFGSVALLLSQNPSMSILPPPRLQSILDALEERDLHLIISRFDDETLTDARKMPRILREIMADGLLINYNSNLPEHMADVIAQNQIPAVWMNSKQDADCVYPDDYDAAKRATEHFIAQGHSRIAFGCASPSSHYSFTDRAAGYTAAMNAANLTPETLLLNIDLTNPQTVRETAGWMRGANPVTAVLTYSYYDVFPIVPAAAAFGLTMPADFVLMTFHHDSIREFGRTIGVMRLPEPEIGRKSVELLIEKIANPAQTFAPLAIPLELLAGDSA